MNRVAPFGFIDAKFFRTRCEKCVCHAVKRALYIQGEGHSLPPTPLLPERLEPLNVEAKAFIFKNISFHW